MIAPQLLVATLVGWFYYMVAMVLTVYDRGLSLIFQPIMGMIFALAGVLICLIAGLPIRFIAPIRAWWRRHWAIPFVIGALAFAAMIASWHPYLRVTVYDEILQAQVQSFEPHLAFGGWLLSIFAALHFWPPRTRQRHAQPV